MHAMHFIDVFPNGRGSGRIEATKLNFQGDAFHGSDAKIHAIQEFPNSPCRGKVLDMIENPWLTIEKDERAYTSIQLVPDKGSMRIILRI